MFEIGKLVIVTKSHSLGIVKKGEIYKIKDMKSLCKHHSLIIDLGIKPTSDLMCCDYCNIIEESKGTYWISSAILSPYEDGFAEHVLEKIEKEIFKEEILELVEQGEELHLKIQKLKK